MFGCQETFLRQVAIVPIEIICPTEIIHLTFSEFMVTISFIIFDFVTELDNQARSQGGEGGGGGGVG